MQEVRGEWALLGRQLKTPNQAFLRHTTVGMKIGAHFIFLKEFEQILTVDLDSSWKTDLE